MLLGAAPPLAVGLVIVAAQASPHPMLPPPTGTSTTEAIATRRAELKHALGPEFGTQVTGPFVVASDASLGEIRRGVRITSESYAALNTLLFDQPRGVVAPNEQPIVDVFLYRERQSYLYHSRLLFRQKPASPHGYYSTKHRAVSIDLSTGEGLDTLRHEVVHPLVQADFPQCPTWLDEGLASYVEHATVVEGVMRAKPNVAHSRKLLHALSLGEVPALRAFTTITGDEFYHYRFGYVHGQHVVSWLRSRKQLSEFYRAFRREVAGDPTGFKTLRSVTGLRGDALERSFLAHVEAVAGALP